MNRILACAVCLMLVSLGSPLLQASPFQDMRSWKDASGKFEVQAKFERVEGDKVVLSRPDGSSIQVPLDRLSPVDQGYVEAMKSKSGSDDDNPFKEMSATPASTPSTTGSSSPSTTGNSNANTTTAEGPRTIDVDYQQVLPMPISVGEWRPKIDAQPAPPLNLKNISVGKKQGFWEKFADAAFNLTAKRAVLTHHFGQPGKPARTRMEMVDLETGRILADASGDGRWKALAIHDDGVRVVVQNMDESDEQTAGQLGTVQLKGKNIVPLDVWKPYESLDQKPKEKVVRFAKFINNGRLLTLSQSGRVVVWDFETRQPVRRFNYHGACQPSLSNDRKHLAICGGDIFGIVNLEDEAETPSVRSAPGMNYWLSSCFSPSCKRFAAATMSKLMVWDVESGDVLFEGNIPGIQTSGKLLFPHEDFVMVNGDKLVEIDTGIKLWRYHGAAATMVHGQPVFIHIGDQGGKIMPISIPHEPALQMLEQAKSKSDLFVLKEGANVGIDVSEVPRQYQEEVRTGLKQNLERKGFVHSENAPVTLKAVVSGPSTEAVSYHFAGSFVVKQYRSNLNIMYDGKSIWASSATNVPGMVSGRDKAGIKKQLDDAGKKPNLNFFSSTNLPDFLQKPTGDGSNNQDRQMLGSTQVGINGLAN